MTLRLNIDRLVVEKSLAGSLGPLDIGPALEAELGRLMAGSKRGRTGIAGDVPQGHLTLASEGTFAERLARTLYEGIPALRSAVRLKGEPTPSLAARPAMPGAGEPIEAASKARMERSFCRDFSAVRVHSSRESALAARAMHAEAFASGSHIAFAEGRYDPSSEEGANLLAHELAHVVQQSGGAEGPVSSAVELEAQADRAAAAVAGGRDVPPLSGSRQGVQRRVEMRRPGRGQQSGFDKLPDLIERLNQISTALIFRLDAVGVLAYTENPYGTETEFDRQMRSLIDDAKVIPLIITNRLGMARHGPTVPFEFVPVDDFDTGYVDIDDLLASDSISLQSTMLHFLTERIRTNRYAHRMGLEPDDFSEAEFQRVHALGIDAEVRFMRDFFGDPGITHLPGESGNVAVQFRTSRPTGARRRDVIRMHITRSGAGARQGLNALSIDVLLADGRVMSADDYRDLIAREREAADRRRLLELRGGPQGPPP
jgi:hypothetical protein